MSGWIEHVAESLALAPEAVVAVDAEGRGPEGAARAIEAAERENLGREGALALTLDGAPDDATLCAWRNAFWPWLHLVAIYDRALTPAEVDQNFTAGSGTNWPESVRNT